MHQPDLSLALSPPYAAERLWIILADGRGGANPTQGPCTLFGLSSLLVQTYLICETLEVSETYSTRILEREKITEIFSRKMYRKSLGNSPFKK
jgi:hypothetical protein